MSESRILLELSAFLDSPQAQALTGIPADDRRVVARRFLEAAFHDLRLPPAELDGEHLRSLLSDALPSRFDPADRLIGAVAPVLDAYFAHLRESAVVAHAFEQTLALDDGLARFTDAVSSKLTPRRRSEAETQPFEHGAARTGRNDPCPCGSGKKYKRCHGRP
ncbi:MAG: SEC-C metal-binding domain-containing protein [Planctomycetota bacterium]|jgi:hypothetical protein